MKSTLTFVVGVSSLILLSACSSTGSSSGGGAGGGGTGGGGGGGGSETPPTMIGGVEVPGYQATQYQDGVNLDDLQADGLEGFGTSGGNLVQTTVQKTADEITIAAGGETLTLNYAGGAPIPNFWQQVERFENTATGNEAFVVNGGFVDVTGLTNAATDEFVAVAVTGQETVNLPTQMARYGGIWMSSSDLVDLGYIAADANFETNELDFTLGSETAGVGGTGIAEISGSQFAGELELFGVAEGSGSLAGAFYGPDADEIAGVSNGTFGGEAYSAGFYGGRYE